MNRDNLLFLAIGLLTGFISGYLLHEVMAARQPARLAAGQGSEGLPAPSERPATAGAPGGVPMEEIIRLRDHVAQNPDDADSVLRLANLNYDIKRWQRAGELYQQYLSLRPDSPDVLTDLGVTLREQQRFDEALVSFSRAQELNPEHWQSLYNQVVVHAFDRQDFESANKLLARLSQMQPGNPEIGSLADEVARRSAIAVN